MFEARFTKRKWERKENEKGVGKRNIPSPKQYDENSISFSGGEPCNSAKLTATILFPWGKLAKPFFSKSFSSGADLATPNGKRNYSPAGNASRQACVITQRDIWKAKKKRKKKVMRAICLVAFFSLVIFIFVLFPSSEVD
jgi:hypothetical protein